jgi:hypothetical protein
MQRKPSSRSCPISAASALCNRQRRLFFISIPLAPILYNKYIFIRGIDLINIYSILWLMNNKIIFISFFQ